MRCRASSLIGKDRDSIVCSNVDLRAHVRAGNVLLGDKQMMLLKDVFVTLPFTTYETVCDHAML